MLDCQNFKFLAASRFGKANDHHHTHFIKIGQMATELLHLMVFKTAVNRHLIFLARSTNLPTYRVNDPDLFFRFLKGRCHGSQFYGKIWVYAFIPQQRFKTACNIAIPIQKYSMAIY